MEKETLERKIAKFYEAIKNDPSSLSFAYKNDGLASDISVALTFWKKSREINIYYLEQDFWRHLMQDAVGHENELIRIIAMTELLPARAWRELLWKENIDFMSLECFLRRLTPEQKEAIRLNYLDYKNGRIPRVMKKGWRNRVKIFFGLMSFKKLSQQKKYEEKRYASKNAWAYNLLGIDFGFSLYPEGEFSDKKITNKSFTRFLSVKEHINDFVVNKENGKYFWMYKTARSNYAFRPGQDVKMRNHVCPGFWATLILHTFFWIISPLALVSALTSIWQFGLSWESVSPAIFALPLITWLTIAFTRFFWNSMVKATKATTGTLKSVNTDHWVIRILKWIGIGLLSVFVLTGVSLWIKWIIEFISVFFMLSPILGPLLTTLLFISVIFYLLTGIAFLNDTAKLKYKNMPKAMRFLALASVMASLVVLLDKFIIDYVIAAIVYLAEFVWLWYSSDFFINTWALLTLAFVISPIFFWKILINNEAKFARMEKIINLIVSIFIILTIGFLLAVWIKSGYINLLTLGHLKVLLIAFGIISIAAYFFMRNMVNKDNLFVRDLIRKTAYELSDSSIKRAELKKLADNPKLKKIILEEEELWHNLKTMSFNIFYRPLERWWFMKMAIQNISLETMRTLIKSEKDLVELKAKKEEEYFSMVVMFMTLENASFHKAKKMADRLSKEKALKKRKKEASLKKLNTRVENLINVLKTPFAFIGTKIYQFFSTLKDLWDFFNKRCPYVSRERNLL
jgi:hypothetical protein